MKKTKEEINQEQKIVASCFINKKIIRIWIEFTLLNKSIEEFGESGMKDLLDNAFKFGGDFLSFEFEHNSKFSILCNDYPPVVSLSEYEPIVLDVLQKQKFSFEISDPVSGEPFFAKEILNRKITSIEFLNFNMTKEDIAFLIKISPVLTKYGLLNPRIGILFTLDSGFQFVIGTEISATLPVFSIFLPSDINKDLERFIVREKVF